MTAYTEKAKVTDAALRGAAEALVVARVTRPGGTTVTTAPTEPVEPADDAVDPFAPDDASVEDWVTGDERRSGV